VYHNTCPFFNWCIGELRTFNRVLNILIQNVVLDFHSFMMLISISILDGILAVVRDYETVAEVKRCIFANSFMGTTIQDSGKRERSNVVIIHLNSYILFWFSFIFYFSLFYFTFYFILLFFLLVSDCSHIM